MKTFSIGVLAFGLLLAFSTLALDALSESVIEGTDTSSTHVD
jgi:hypothetical protein